MPEREGDITFGDDGKECHPRSVPAAKLIRRHSLECVMGVSELTNPPSRARAKARMTLNATAPASCVITHSLLNPVSGFCPYVLCVGIVHIP